MARSAAAVVIQRGVKAARYFGGVEGRRKPFRLCLLWGTRGNGGPRLPPVARLVSGDGFYWSSSPLSRSLLPAVPAFGVGFFL